MFQSEVLDLGDLLVHLMVDEILFLFAVQVDPELNVEWPGNNMSSPRSVVQFCLKTGSGTVK